MNGKDSRVFSAEKKGMWWAEDALQRKRPRFTQGKRTGRLTRWG